LGGAHSRDIHAHGNDNIYIECENRFPSAYGCVVYRSIGHFNLPRHAIFLCCSSCTGIASSFGRRHFSLERRSNKLILLKRRLRPPLLLFTYTKASRTPSFSLVRCLCQ